MLNKNLQEKLGHLRLNDFLKAGNETLQTLQDNGLCFESILEHLVDSEINGRFNRKIQRLFNSAKLRYQNACLENIDYDPKRKIKKSDINRFATCEWIKQGRGLILSGPTGVGKSWLACAFGTEACNQGLSVMYFSAVSLFDEMSEAITLGNIRTFKKKICNTNLLIIDDFGLGEFRQDLAPSFLEIIDKQSQKGGILITSQVPKELWDQQFHDPAISDAILDRILHRSYDLEISGQSYREKISKNMEESLI